MIVDYGRRVGEAHDNVAELRRLIADVDATDELREIMRAADARLARLVTTVHTMEVDRVNGDAGAIAEAFGRALEIEVELNTRAAPNREQGWPWVIVTGAVLVVALLAATVLTMWRRRR